MEVLISMGVLAVGLLGIAALIPAGRYQIAQGTRLEQASLVGRSAFRELQIRGYMNPETWRSANGTAVWDSANLTMPVVDVLNGGGQTDQVAVVIDPLGIVAGYDNAFPTSAGSPRRMLRIAPFDPPNSPAAADLAFRSSLDLITQENTINRELPPTQFFFKDAANNRARRSSDGNYTWLATITSDPAKANSADPASSAARGEMTVSVAVFSKRNLSAAGAGEVIADVSATAPGPEVILQNLPAGDRAVKPGEWLMMAGTTTGNITRFNWHRVLAAQPRSGTSQAVTLWGPTINQFDTYDAWLFDNIVNVYQKTMSLEIE